MILSYYQRKIQMHTYLYKFSKVIFNKLQELKDKVTRTFLLNYQHKIFQDIFQYKSNYFGLQKLNFV
jgi:hypothetical protein